MPAHPKEIPLFYSEPSRPFFRQNKVKKTNFLVGTAGLALLLGWGQTAAQAAERAAGVPGTAKTALKALAEGHPADALAELRSALAQTPDSPTLNLLAGTVALQCGDPQTAQTAFERAGHALPSEALPKYGAGLAYLELKQFSTAQIFFERARKLEPLRFDLQEAQNYLSWLAGKGWESGAAQSNPSALQSLTAALDAVKHQKADKAVSILESLYREAREGGLKATGSRELPLTVFAPRSTRSLLPKPIRETDALSGTIQLSPENAEGFSYVGFEIDGDSIGLVSTYPFSLTWNTRQAANGSHTLAMVFYNASGSESRRITRTLKIKNAGTQETLSAELKSSLWNSLALTPDPAALAEALGRVEAQAGHRIEAQTWFWTVLALHPQEARAKSELVKAGGLPAPTAPLYAGRTGEKVIALTFDDGPKPGMTEALLDFLVREKIPSTFFVIGKHVDAAPQLARKIADAGMELANHSYTHRNLTRLSTADLEGELAKTQAAILRATGKTPLWMRPPGGNWNEGVAQTVRQWGMTPCFWTVDVYGSEVLGTRQVAEQTLAQVKPGSIVLMHNGKMSTLQALPGIVRELKRQGYRFVTISDLNARLHNAPPQEKAAILSRYSAKKRKGE